MKQPRTEALCCVCGRVRTVVIVGRHYIAHEPRGSDWGSPDSWGDRCIIDRECETCREVTAHAYLRTDDGRDSVEQRQAELDKIVRDPLTGLAALEDEMALLGVRLVTTDTQSPFLVQSLDEGGYFVTVPETFAPIKRLGPLMGVSALLRGRASEALRWQVQPSAGPDSPPMAFMPLKVELGVDPPT